MLQLASFQKNNADMLNAAERCIELRQYLPSLVLIYSHIDTLAWSGSKKLGGDTRRTFEAWVNRWLLPHLKSHAPPITATDVYGARCGVLHTLTSKSGLSAKGYAREIAYGWGTGRAEILQAVIDGSVVRRQLVVLQYQELLKCLRLAVEDFVASAANDTELARELIAADAKHYMNIPIPPSGAP